MIAFHHKAKPGALPQLAKNISRDNLTTRLQPDFSHLYKSRDTNQLIWFAQ